MEGFNQVVVGWSSEDCARALADWVASPAGGEPWGLRAPKASVTASSSRALPRATPPRKKRGERLAPGAEPLEGPVPGATAAAGLPPAPLGPRPRLSPGRTGGHATGWPLHPPGHHGRSGDREGGAHEGALRPVVGPWAPACPRITP